MKTKSETLKYPPTEQRVTHDVELAIPCGGNVQGLTACLTAVLNGTVVPSLITVYMTGGLPGSDDFYLTQLASLARIKGIQFVVVHPPKDLVSGIRQIRDHMKNSYTVRNVWMLDDDVMPVPYCLEAYCAFLGNVGKKYSYAVGSKPDVNNRRGYKDFDTTPKKFDDFKVGVSYNTFWDFSENKIALGDSVLCETLDTGNCLINAEDAINNAFMFDYDGTSYNAGGEDCAFALQVHCSTSATKSGWFIPTAAAYHLEKPGIVFNEFAARNEMLRLFAARMDDVKGAQRIVEKEHMPFEKLT